MIIVLLKKGADREAFIFLLEKHGYKYTPRLSRVFTIESTSEEFALTDYADIESIEENIVFDLVFNAEDIFNTNISTSNKVTVTNPATWGRHRVIRKHNPFKKQGDARTSVFDLPYRCERTGEGVDIYMIDQGINAFHQEFTGGRVTLAGAAEGAFILDSQIGDTEFITSRGESGGHGHLCASCAVGSSVGIATGAKLFFVQMLTTQGTAIDMDTYLELFQIVFDHYMSRAGENRPAVVSISMGGIRIDSGTPALIALMDEMMDNGLVIVTAAGNRQIDLDTVNMYPGELHDDVIIVGATDSYDMPMYKYSGWGTSFGSTVDIYAPGENLMVAYYDEGATNDAYLQSSGTSFSCPIVAGVLACMLQGYQRLTTRAQSDALRQKLLDNSTKGALRFEANFPGGVINNNLVYLDPFVDFEVIDGLNPL
jgi:subtilisin family serine protease